MHVEPAVSTGEQRPLPLRSEITAEFRGRPCAVIAWFAPAEPAVGLLRPSLITALAIDPDGEVYEQLTKDELDPIMARLQARAEQSQEG